MSEDSIKIKSLSIEQGQGIVRFNVVLQLNPWITDGLMRSMSECRRALFVLRLTRRGLLRETWGAVELNGKTPEQPESNARETHEVRALDEARSRVRRAIDETRG